MVDSKFHSGSITTDMNRQSNSFVREDSPLVLVAEEGGGGRSSIPQNEADVIERSTNTITSNQSLYFVLSCAIINKLFVILYA